MGFHSACLESMNSIISAQAVQGKQPAWQTLWVMEGGRTYWGKEER